MNPDRCAPSDPTPTVHKLMLDTNVVDKLLADAKLAKCLVAAVASGKVQLFVTHVQADEIARMPDHKDERRAALLKVLTAVPANRVPTAGVVLDHSRFDQAMFGSDSNADLFHVLIAGNHRHIEDAQIVLTAAWLYADIVSDDTRVRKTMAASVGITAYATHDLWELFRRWLAPEPGTPR